MPIKANTVRKIIELLKWTFVYTKVNMFYDKTKIDRKIKLGVINNLAMF
jgi:hypothetical protein